MSTQNSDTSFGKLRCPDKAEQKQEEENERPDYERKRERKEKQRQRKWKQGARYS